MAVLLDFVQMRGGGGRPCPNFLSTFHKLYILGQFGDVEGGGDPCPICLAHWLSKKVAQFVQIRGRGLGVEVIWTKSKRTATFFRETFPESRIDCFQSIISFQFYSQYSNGTASRRAEGQLHAMVLLTPKITYPFQEAVKYYLADFFC